MMVVAGVLAAGLGCGNDEPPPAPTPTEKPKPKVKPTEMRVSSTRVGTITKSVEPTIEGVEAALSSFYQVVPNIGGLAGARIAVKFDGEVVLQVFPSEDGERIERIYSRSEHVTFPWETKVGARMGDQKHWDRMSCELAEAPFEGRALCKGYEKGRVAYLVEGWEGEATTLPGKDAIAELKIAGLLWTPTYGE
jgi:hypothetical protein